MRKHCYLKRCLRCVTQTSQVCGRHRKYLTCQQTNAVSCFKECLQQLWLASVTTLAYQISSSLIFSPVSLLVQWSPSVRPPDRPGHNRWGHKMRPHTRHYARCKLSYAGHFSSRSKVVAALASSLSVSCRRYEGGPLRKRSSTCSVNPNKIKFSSFLPRVSIT